MYLKKINLSPRQKKILVIVFFLIITIAIILGIYYGIKSSNKNDIKTESSGTSVGTTTTTSQTTINIPNGKIDITTGKMIIYEPIKLKSLGTCINGSTRFGFMNSTDLPVNKVVSTNINFPEFKIILNNSLYLKKFEDTNRIKLWYISEKENKIYNWIADDFYGRILAYEQQDTSSSKYKYMVWMDFSKLPETILNNWDVLPKTGFYNLYMNTTDMKATLEYLDDLYISNVPSEINYVCKQSNPKSWTFEMKTIQSTLNNKPT